MHVRTAVLTALLLSSTSALRAQTVSTLATGFRGDALLVEPSGDVLVSDYLGGSDRPDQPKGSSVRRITAGGQVSTFMRGLFAPTGLARAADGTVYVATASPARLDSGVVMRRSVDGRVTRFADGMQGLAALAVLPNGDLLAASPSAAVVHRIDRNGAVTDFARDTLLRDVTGLAVAGDTVYVSTFSGGRLFRLLAGSAPQLVARITSATSLSPVNYIAVRDGAVYANIGALDLARSDGHRVVRITQDGTVTTIAGNGEGGARDGAALDARFLHNAGIGISPDGRVIYVSDWNGLRAIRMP